MITIENTLEIIHRKNCGDVTEARFDINGFFHIFTDIKFRHIQFQFHTGLTLSNGQCHLDYYNLLLFLHIDRM